MELENKIINLYNQKHSNVTDRKIIRLLKIVLVDKEEDIDKIINSVPIAINTIKKYINEKQGILKYLSVEEFEMFEAKVNFIQELKNEKEKKEELKLIGNIIDEIYHTRHKLSDICRSNFFSLTKFQELMLDETFMDKNFGAGTNLKVKNKIEENGLMRLRAPRDHYLVEDRWSVFLTKPEIIHLSKMDFKKLSFASSYICSGADLQYVIEKHQTSISFALNILSDPNLQSILKPEYYENLKVCMYIENNLVNNNLTLKREFFSEVLSFLYENDLDKELAMQYFKIPENLFNRVLQEILKAPYINSETKIEISNILNIENEKKVK